EAATKKRPFEVVPPDPELKNFVKDFATDTIVNIANGALDKQVRREALETLKKDLVTAVEEKFGEEYAEEHAAQVSELFEKLKKELIRNIVLEHAKRLDGRKLDEIRPIWAEVDYLPAAHGS